MKCLDSCQPSPNVVWHHCGGDVCLIADNLNQNDYPNIEFFGRFGEILTIRLLKTFNNCLNSQASAYTNDIGERFSAIGSLWSLANFGR